MIITDVNLEPYRIKYDSGSGYTLVKIGIVSDEAVAGKVSVNADKEKEDVVGYFNNIGSVIKRVIVLKAEDQQEVWELKDYLEYLRETNATLLNCLNEVQ